MFFEGVLDGGGVDGGENVAVFVGVEDMDDVGFGEFVFHLEEDIEGHLTV